MAHYLPPIAVSPRVYELCIDQIGEISFQGLANVLRKAPFSKLGRGSLNEFRCSKGLARRPEMVAVDNVLREVSEM